MKNVILASVFSFVGGCGVNMVCEGPRPVSLPEEYQEIKTGELLKVEKVGDSIYLGFNKDLQFSWPDDEGRPEVGQTVYVRQIEGNMIYLGND